MGSWLGRVAAGYRISVQQLCGGYGLELDIDALCAGWLVLPAVPEFTIRQLARLARYLFVNPVDVTAQRWKRVG